MEHVRWLARPTLRRPVVVAAFTGWNDAGDAASNSVRHLIESWNATPLAEIDPEEFTDFATVRPHVRLDADRRRNIVWPTVGLWSASTPGGDVILVLGPEPALRWKLFIEQIAGVAVEMGSSMLLTLGALLADVPHTRDVRLMGTATDEAMIDRFGLQRSNYEGPDGHRRRAARRVRRPRPALGLAVGGGARLRVADAVAEGVAGAGGAHLRDPRLPGADRRPGGRGPGVRLAGHLVRRGRQRAHRLRRPLGVDGRCGRARRGRRRGRRRRHRRRGAGRGHRRRRSTATT